MKLAEQIKNIALENSLKEELEQMKACAENSKFSCVFEKVFSYEQEKYLTEQGFVVEDISPNEYEPLTKVSW